MQNYLTTEGQKKWPWIKLQLDTHEGMLRTLEKIAKYLEWREDTLVETHDEGEYNEYSEILEAIKNGKDARGEK